MIDRHQARILAMQALCMHEVQPDDSPAHLDAFLAEDDPPADVQDHARGLVRDAWEKKTAIDERIQGASEHWDIARMTMVDRSVLRVAVCEMLERPNVPVKVVIDEAIEIGKEFGTSESGAFINGVLDAIRKGLKQAPTRTPPQSESP